MEQKFKNYILKCDFDLYYYDDIISYLNEHEKAVLSFFNIEKLDKPCTIEIMNWKKFKDFQLNNIGEVCEYKRAVTDVNSKSIKVLLLEDQIIYTTHKNATLEDTLKTILHEFVHIVHSSVQKYKKELTWFFEGVATNLAKKNYELANLNDCDFAKLVNDFKNFGKGSYRYSYTIVNYILNNYSKEEIYKLIYDTNYLFDNSYSIFENIKNNIKNN